MTNDRPPIPPDTHDVSAPGDRYEALAEFLEQHASQEVRDQVREQEERDRRRRRSTAPYWTTAALLLLTAWLWLLPPGILRMDPPPPQPAQQEEAALRFAMYLQAQRIKAHRAERGAYPERLEEAGPPLPGIRYVRLAPELYQLTGTTDRVTLTYSSDLPLDAFVGRGAEVLDVAAP